MSKHDYEAPRPDDATQLRHVLPRTEEPEVVSEVPPLPQPRTAAADPFTGASVARAPASGEEPPTGITAVRPVVSAPGERFWASAPATPASVWPDPAPTPPPPQHSRPVPAVPPSPRTDGSRAGLLAAMIAAIVVITGGAGFWTTWHAKSDLSSELSSKATDYSGSLPAGGSNASSGTKSSGTTSGGVAGSPSTPDPDSASTTAAVPTVNPETAALDQLNAIRSDSVARVALDGRWVAQVASKSVGISDPLQTTRTGSHTFMAADILAESLQARQTVANPDLNVYVLWGTDFGKRSHAPNGSPYWITLVDAGFSNSKAVQGWCQRTYSSLTPAQLADTCAPRQLTPPHS